MSIVSPKLMQRSKSALPPSQSGCLSTTCIRSKGKGFPLNAQNSTGRRKRSQNMLQRAGSQKSLRTHILPAQPHKKPEQITASSQALSAQCGAKLQEVFTIPNPSLSSFGFFTCWWKFLWSEPHNRSEYRTFWSNPTSSKACLQAAAYLYTHHSIRSFVTFSSVSSKIKHGYFQTVHPLLSLKHKNVFKETPSRMI